MPELRTSAALMLISVGLGLALTYHRVIKEVFYMLILSAVFSLVFIVSTESLAAGLLASSLWVLASFLMF